MGAGGGSGGYQRVYSICQPYSTPEGCPAGTSCYYQHVCAKPGCYGDHPGYRHSEFVKAGLGVPG